MKKAHGFTTIELLTAIAILIAAGAIFIMQKNDLAAQHRDSDRKTAINAMYYAIEEIVYPSLKGYPAKLSEDTLKGIDKKRLKDSNGVFINDQNSQYTYEPSICNGDVCQHYRLKAKLEKEQDFVKDSAH